MDELETLLYVFGGIAIIVTVFFVIWTIFGIVAKCLLFKKIGEPWYYGIIPVFNTYRLYLATEADIRGFYLYVAALLVSWVISPLISGIIYSFLDIDISGFFDIAVRVALLIANICLFEKLSNRMGGGVIMMIVLLFIEPIGMLILALNNNYEFSDNDNGKMFFDSIVGDFGKYNIPVIGGDPRPNAVHASPELPSDKPGNDPKDDGSEIDVLEEL